jgi:uncharacterized membrane protein
MNTFILLLVGTIVSFYVWIKKRNKQNFHYLLLCGAGLLMMGWEYLTKNIFHLSNQSNTINKYFILVFWVLAGIFFVIITLKDSKK